MGYSLKKSCTYCEQDPEKVNRFLKELNHLSYLTPIYIYETGVKTYFYLEYDRALSRQLVSLEEDIIIWIKIETTHTRDCDTVIEVLMPFFVSIYYGSFEACFQKFLLPTLDTPSLIIMDNARFHRMNMCKEQGIDCYHFLPIHPSIIPLRKYGLTSKTSQNNIVKLRCFSWGTFVLFLFQPTILRYWAATEQSMGRWGDIKKSSSFVFYNSILENWQSR